MMHIQTSRPGLKVVQVSSGVDRPARKPAPQSQGAPDIQDTTGEESPQATNKQTQKQQTMNAFDNPLKQRAAAQIAITAGLGTAAYFLKGTNQIAFWLFLIGAVIAGYTVVQPHQRKDGSLRPSAIQALQAASIQSRPAVDPVKMEKVA